MTASRPDTLAEIEAAIWRELQAAVTTRGHGWRLGVLATRDGDEVDARNVVVRELELEARTLLMYTDARSPKAGQLTQHPRGVLVLWSRELGWQLRLRVDLSLQTSGLAVSSRWARLKMTPAAQDYLSPLPPGHALGGPEDGAASRAAPPQRASREHFAVVAAQVQSIDWLALDPQGHRRALFDAEGARWVAP